MAKHIVALAVAFALSVAAACGGAVKDAASPSCADFEAVGDRGGLIRGDEAEESAVERLSMSAPEVTGTDVERVWASCLTTLRSYGEELLGEGTRTNPDLYPPDTAIWIVEVKGISRPAGISTASADKPYRYAMHVSNARTGEFLAGSRYREPRFRPAQGE